MTLPHSISTSFIQASLPTRARLISSLARVKTQTIDNLSAHCDNVDAMRQDYHNLHCNNAMCQRIARTLAYRAMLAQVRSLHTLQHNVSMSMRSAYIDAIESIDSDSRDDVSRCKDMSTLATLQHRVDQGMQLGYTVVKGAPNATLGMVMWDIDPQYQGALCPDCKAHIDIHIKRKTLYVCPQCDKRLHQRIARCNRESVASELRQALPHKLAHAGYVGGCSRDASIHSLGAMLGAGHKDVGGGRGLSPTVVNRKKRKRKRKKK